MAGQHERVQGGNSFARPRADGFRDVSQSDHQALLDEVASGRPWREVIDARFATARPWLHRVITSPARTSFLEQVLPASDGAALDIGAGWGQIARALAQRRPVVALEPVAERLAFIEAAARQEGCHARMAFLEIDYLETEFVTRFDSVCAIGVLEWVGAFQGHEDPQARQRRFLAKIRQDLRPGGSFVLGIENRLGLKYLLGSPDDHIGVPHIANLPAPLAIRRWSQTSGHPLRSFTYSSTELAEMLHQAGFQKLEFFGAFPDYKVPENIVPFGPDGAALNDWLLRNAVPREHNGYDGTHVTDEFQETLAAHYQTLAQEGVAHRFVPSFFVRAS